MCVIFYVYTGLCISNYTGGLQVLDIKEVEFKSERLAIRVAKKEKEMLEKLAKHYKTTMSEVVISMIKYHHESLGKK